MRPDQRDSWNAFLRHGDAPGMIEASVAPLKGPLRHNSPPGGDRGDTRHATICRFCSTPAQRLSVERRSRARCRACWMMWRSCTRPSGSSLLISGIRMKRNVSSRIRKHANLYAGCSALHDRPFQFYHSLMLVQEYGVWHKSCSAAIILSRQSMQA